MPLNHIRTNMPSHTLAVWSNLAGNFALDNLTVNHNVPEKFVECSQHRTRRGFTDTHTHLLSDEERPIPLYGTLLLVRGGFCAKIAPCQEQCGKGSKAHHVHYKSTFKCKVHRHHHHHHHHLKHTVRHLPVPVASAIVVVAMNVYVYIMTTPTHHQPTCTVLKHAALPNFVFKAHSARIAWSCSRFCGILCYYCRRRHNVRPMCAHSFVAYFPQPCAHSYSKCILMRSACAGSLGIHDAQKHQQERLQY